MKKIIIIYILSYFLVYPISAQQCSINLSSQDCVTCIANMAVLMKSFPDAKIVLNINEIEDSTDIIEKFGLTKFSDKIEWAESGSSQSGYPISWVTITDGSKVIYRDTLKTMDFLDLSDVLKNNHLEACKRKLPKADRITISGKDILLGNQLYAKYYMYDFVNDSLAEYRLNNDIYSKIFDALNFSKDDQEFFTSFYSKEPSFKPKYGSACYINNTLYAVAEVLLLDEIIGHDSFWSKQYAILKSLNTNPEVLGFLDQNSLPKPYYYDGSLICWNDKYYIGVNMHADTLLSKPNGTIFEKLAEITLQDGKFIFNKFLPFTLPDYLVKYKIGYNATNLRTESGLISFAFSNSIYNLNTLESIRIPLEKQVIPSFANFMTNFSSEYFLEDFIWDSKTNIYTIKFIQEGEIFVANFKPGDRRFRNKTFFMPRKDFYEKYYTSRLQQNGYSLVLFEKSSGCLVNYELKDLKSQDKKY